MQNPELLSTYELWLAVFSILTTIFSALFLAFAKSLNVWAKRGVVALVAVILSAVGLWYQGLLDTGDLARTWLVVFVGATGVYHLLYKSVAAAFEGMRRDEYDPLP